MLSADLPWTKPKSLLFLPIFVRFSAFFCVLMVSNKLHKLLIFFFKQKRMDKKKPCCWSRSRPPASSRPASSAGAFPHRGGPALRPTARRRPFGRRQPGPARPHRSGSSVFFFVAVGRELSSASLSQRVKTKPLCFGNFIYILPKSSSPSSIQLIDWIGIGIGSYS